jgi:hypothetical protein
MKNILISIFLGCSFFLTSCATTIDAFYSPQAAQFIVKSIYLVNKNEESKEMDERIKKELEKRNIKVLVGPDSNTTKAEDAVMKYTESWKTELTTNLDALDIILFDKKGELIASSHWKNSKFSTLASVSSLVSDSLEVIFERVQIKP